MIVEPDDREWRNVRVMVPTRVGRRRGRHLSRERTEGWRARGRPQISDPDDPDYLAEFEEAAERGRNIGFTVNIPEERADGEAWDGELDLKCRRCGHMPKLTVSIIVKEARSLAFGTSRGRSIYV